MPVITSEPRGCAEGRELLKFLFATIYSLPLFAYRLGLCQACRTWPYDGGVIILLYQYHILAAVGNNIRASKTNILNRPDVTCQEDQPSFDAALLRGEAFSPGAKLGSSSSARIAPPAS